MERFQQKLSSYNIPAAQRKNAVAGFEDARADFSHQSETMCDLLAKKEKIELDFLNFMNRVFSEYELNGEKISFHNATARQQYA